MIRSKILDKYKKEIIYGISSKRDGNMSSKFDSLKVVISRRKKFLNKFGLSIKNLVLLEQKHTNKVVIAKKEHLGFAEKNETPFKPADGIITKDRGIILGIFIGDCLPIFFYDSKKKIIGLIHAGWQGLYKGIIKETIKKFKKLKSNPSDILVFLGPSIGPCHYYVEKERIDLFKRKFKFKTNSFFKKADDKYFLDLWKVAYLLLIREGIKKVNIEISKICTYCQKNLYSHRKTREKNFPRGRMFAFFVLR